ncbi:MAG TPA: CDP-glycerol glycerophosphotransferase family protein [Bacilli bacterium]|nr:CDP-glycerol glycerophosphotransferase family protein [Bacilli bacterium]
MKYALLFVGKIGLNFIYLFFKLLPTRDRITLISRQSNNITLDFKLLKKEIENHKKYDVIVLCKKLEGKDNAKISEILSYIGHMFKQMYYISTSKWIVLDSYCIAASLLKHKKNLKIMQMWHSIGTMKKFGYDILDLQEGSSKKMAKLMRMHMNYDIVLCAGQGYKKDLIRQFNCDSKNIRICPLPRVDLLLDAKYKAAIKKKIVTKYSTLKYKKTILYCPTFRVNEDNFKSNVDKLISCVDFKKYNLIVKLHPNSRVINLPIEVIDDKAFSTMEMLFVSDYIITDYSCILYEAAILNKPLYFYNFDFDDYHIKRDLNIDYLNELPGTISGDPKKIIEAIETNQYDFTKLSQFTKKYINVDKNNTSKIYKIIEKGQ